MAAFFLHFSQDSFMLYILYYKFNMSSTCVRLLLKFCIIAIVLVQIGYTCYQFSTVITNPTNYKPYMFEPDQTQSCFSTEAPYVKWALLSPEQIATQLAQADKDFIIVNCFYQSQTKAEGLTSCTRSDLQKFYFPEDEFVSQFNNPGIKITGFVFMAISFLITLVIAIQDWKTIIKTKTVEKESIKQFMYFFILDSLLVPFYSIWNYPYLKQCLGKSNLIGIRPSGLIGIGVGQLILLPILAFVLLSKDSKVYFKYIGAIVLLSVFGLNLYIVISVLLLSPIWIICIVIGRFGLEILGIFLGCCCSSGSGRGMIVVEPRSELF